MYNDLLVLEKFRAWAETQDDECVGIVRSCTNCPIANYLNANVAVQHEVGRWEIYIRENGEIVDIPEWVRMFIDRLDLIGMDKEPAPKWRVMEILEAVEKKLATVE